MCAEIRFMQRQSPPRRHVRKGVSTGLASIVAVALAAALAPAVRAQSLDDQVRFYLQNDCSNLGFANFDPALFGVNLQGICTGQPSGVFSANGGGAASPQGSTLSIESNPVQRRLERARKKAKQDDERSSRVFALFSGRSGRARKGGSTSSEDAGAGAASSRFDLFASGTYESVDRSSTVFEDAYDSSTVGGAIGFDYQFNEVVVAGLVAGYRKQDGDFRGGGSFEMTAVEPSVYVSILPSARTFLQVVAGYGSQHSDVDRSVLFAVADPNDPNTSTTIASGTTASSPDATAYNGSVQFGFDQPAGRFTFGPRVGVNYNRSAIDGFTETGSTGLELRNEERTVTSFQGVVGFFGSGAFSTKGGVVIPQIHVEYVREFEDEANLITARFAEDLRGVDATTFTYQTNVPDSSFVNVRAGVGAVFAHGIQLFVNFRTMIGNNTFESSGGTIGLRFEL